MTRRPVKTALVIAAVGIGLWAIPGRSDPKPAPPLTPPVEAPHPADPEQIRQAVARGLTWLRDRQDATGAWVQDVGFKRGNGYEITTASQPHVGVTALALMAFLSGGHLPGRGEYGRVVERGTDWLLAQVDPRVGYISAHDTRMYSHAFATLFLAEIYGMTHRDDVKEKLQLAVDLIVKSQNQLGSWRYRPYSTTADMSITVCQIMALRAARNVGIRVPRATVERAQEYVEKSAYVEKNTRRYGGFRYKLEPGARTTVPLTAAGVATLNHAGIYDGSLVEGGINYLVDHLPELNNRFAGHYFFYYGHYYAAQVFFLCSADLTEDDLWQSYWEPTSRVFLSLQQGDGSWPNSTGPGAAFGTAVACIILQIPNQYLPIFHR